MDNFQRPGSISNAHVGNDFENIARQIFSNQGLKLKKNFRLPLGINKKKKDHNFDLGSESPRTIVECKCHRWTKDSNVPSAKMSVWNEAMYYFHTAPKSYRKILFVLYDFNMKKKETLAEYYIRTYDHLIPSDVEIWEYNEETGGVNTWET